MVTKKEIKKKTIHTFSEWADHYDGDRWSWYFRRCYRETFDFSARYISNNTRILDVGCGTGQFLWNLSERFPDSTLHGLELTKSMYDLASKKLERKKVQLFNEDLESFVAPIQYDLIYCLNTFHHFEESSLAAQKMSKMLAKNGIIIILDPFRDGIFRLAWEEFSKHLLFHEPYINYLTTDAFHKIMEGSGLSFTESKSFLYVILLSCWRKINVK